MALEKSGIELVAENQARFSATLDKAVGSLKVFERAGASAARGIDALGNIATGALRRIGELGVDALVRAGRELLRFAARSLEAAAEGTQLADSLEQLSERALGIARFNLDPLFEQFDGLLTRAGPAIEGFINFGTRAFSNMARNALVWGENISTSLAQGIFDGAGAVLDALIYIGNLIADLLMPGSPPRLLPNLDSWGTEAANVYLKGWTEADFSVFDTIAGQIESLLRSSAGPNDRGLIPRILGTREAIAQAIEQARLFGEVTQESLDAIFAAAGATTPEMQGYLQSVFELDLANEQLTAAQEKLNRVTKEYEALLKPIEDALAGIDEEQAQLAEDQQKSLLAMILLDPNSSAADKRRAQLEIERIGAERARRAAVAAGKAAVDSAQAEVDAAADVQAQAEAEYAAKKALFDLQVEQNQLMKEQIALLERLSKAESGGAGPKGPGGKGPGGIVIPIRPEWDLTDFIPQELLDKLEELKATFERVWAAIVATLQPAIDAWNNDVRPAWDRLVDSFLNSLPLIERSIARTIAFLVQQMGVILPGIFGNVADGLDTLSRLWDKHGDLIIVVMEGAFRVIATTVGVYLLLLSGTIAAALRIIEGLFDAAMAIVNADWEGAWDAIYGTVVGVWEIMDQTLTTAWASVALLFKNNTEGLREKWDTFWGDVKATVDDILPSVQTAIEVVMVAIAAAIAVAATPLLVFIQALKDFWEWLNDRVFSLNIDLPHLPSVFSAALGSSLVAPPAGAGQIASNSYASTYAPQWNYSPVYSGSPPSPRTDFAIMEVMAS